METLGCGLDFYSLRVRFQDCGFASCSVWGFAVSKAIDMSAWSLPRFGSCSSGRSWLGHIVYKLLDTSDTAECLHLSGGRLMKES